MSYQDEQQPQPATTAPVSNEVEQLRDQLRAAQEETAIATFLGRLSREFPAIPQSDLRALVRDRLSFKDGQLIGEDGALSYLQSRPFLQPQTSAALTSSSATVNPASPGAHRQWAELEARKAYLKTLFGKGSNAKQAHELAKSDIDVYRRLKAESQRLGVYGR